MGGKSVRKCEICGIRRRKCTSGIFLAKFPLDPNRCRLWVKATGNEDLAYLPPLKLNENKFVCGNHFPPNMFNEKGTRLKRNAVPTLILANLPLSDEILVDFPIRQAKDAGTISIIKPIDSVPSTSGITTSSKRRKITQSEDTLLDNITDNVETKAHSTPRDDNADPQPCQKNSTSFSWQEPNVAACSVDDDLESVGTVDDVDTHSMYDDPAVVDNKPVDQQEQDVTSEVNQIHVGYTCNECKDQIIRFRYACIQCKDYDICSMCEARGVHDIHYMLRIPRPRPPTEIRAVMEKLRAQLSNTLTVESPSLILDDMKIKDESEDPLQIEETVTSLDVPSEDGESSGSDNSSVAVSKTPSPFNEHDRRVATTGAQTSKEVTKENDEDDVDDDTDIRPRTDFTDTTRTYMKKILVKNARDNIIETSAPLERPNLTGNLFENTIGCSDIKLCRSIINNSLVAVSKNGAQKSEEVTKENDDDTDIRPKTDFTDTARTYMRKILIKNRDNIIKTSAPLERPNINENTFENTVGRSEIKLCRSIIKIPEKVLSKIKNSPKSVISSRKTIRISENELGCSKIIKISESELNKIRNSPIDALSRTKTMRIPENELRPSKVIKINPEKLLTRTEIIKNVSQKEVSSKISIGKISNITNEAVKRRILTVQGTLEDESHSIDVGKEKIQDELAK